MNASSFDVNMHPKPASENGFMKLNQAREDAFTSWTIRTDDKKASKASADEVGKETDDETITVTLPQKSNFKEYEKDLLSLTEMWRR